MKILLGQPYSFCQTGRRGNQEDARYPNEDVPMEQPCYYVVCDGVGGEEAGEIASSTVCEAMGSYMSQHFDASSFTVEDFSNALDFAYSALYKKGKKYTSEMATTLTFACFHENGVLAAHIGDSRIYQIRPEVGIMYRSDDHSLVNAMVHSGNMTPEEAISNPQSNIITRCMECVSHKEGRAMATVININDIEPGDYFFLCTDGVMDKLNDEDIVSILRENIEDEKKCQVFAERCSDSSDNNTAFLIPIEDVIKNNNDDFVEDKSVSVSSDTKVLSGFNGTTDVMASSVPTLLDKIKRIIDTIITWIRASRL